MSENYEEREWRLYLYLMKCAIRKQKLREEELKDYQDITYDTMCEHATRNGQIMLMSSILEEYAQWRNKGECIRKISVVQVMEEYEMYKCIRNVLDAARERKLPLVVFKGCVLADLYPEYIQRQSCDADFYVDKKYKAAATELLQQLGYVIDPTHGKNEVTIFRYQKFPHMIELHTCLWEDFKGKRLDTLQSFGLTDPDKLIELDVCGFRVTTLGYEEHLIYQIFHIIKHFSLEGVGVKYLADISLYVDAYGRYIDYDHFWHRMDELGYTKFVHCLFILCIELLEMSSDIMQGRRLEMGPELMELLSDLFHSGKIYGRNRDSWQILGMMTPYFSGEKRSKKSNFARKLSVIFLRPKDLQDNYGFAKKYPILLPIAWVKRIFDYLKKYCRNPEMTYNASQKLNLAEHRIDLLDKMDLMS